MSVHGSNMETMQKVVDSAVVLFNKNGFSGASIGDISKHAGVSKGILYYYFKNKDELYLHCTKKCIEDFRSYLNQKLKVDDNNELLVHEFLRLRISFFEEHPNYSNLFLNILAKKPDHLSFELTEVRKEFKEENLRLIIKYLSKLPLGKGVTNEDISTFISVLQSYSATIAETHSDAENSHDRERVILRMATIFINGLKEDIE